MSFSERFLSMAVTRTAAGEGSAAPGRRLRCGQREERACRAQSSFSLHFTANRQDGVVVTTHDRKRLGGFVFPFAVLFSPLLDGSQLLQAEPTPSIIQLSHGMSWHQSQKAEQQSPVPASGNPQSFHFHVRPPFCGMLRPNWTANLPMRKSHQ